MRSRKHVRLLALVAVLPLVACSAAADDEAAGDDFEAEAAGNPRAIDIGFNGGADQFAYYEDFFSRSSVHAGPRLCHWYVPWNIADQPPGVGSASSPRTSRAYFEFWLHQAQVEGHCEEALISFQADAPACPPTEKEFATAAAKFISIPWAKETGFTGSFSFTPWNEPDNGGGAGNGLGKALEPELAARYYLSMARLCEKHGCKVAAGDFASNGNWWNDFEWNCANDNVESLTVTPIVAPSCHGAEPPPPKCKTPSAYNKDGRKPASYLDRYKHVIANHAGEYGLGKNFRPKYFAFHGWHDINEYLDAGSHCVDYEHCATRRVLKSLGGSWGGVEIWDTEAGVGQGKEPPPPGKQACGAAFLIRLTAMSHRITRLYYTRLHHDGGGGALLDGHTPRPALSVLANRQTTVPAGGCW